MTGIDIEVIADMIEESASAKDVKKLYLLVVKLREAVTSDPTAVKWLVEPKNIKRIQDSLLENFDIPAKSLMLGTRVTNRQQRAIMMMQAMETTMKRVLDNGVV